MRLARFLDPSGKVRIGVESSPQHVVTFSGPMDKSEPTLLRFLENTEYREVAQSAIETIIDGNNASKKKTARTRNNETVEYDMNEITILPPIGNPHKIICMGGNFDDHLQEGSKTRPDFPISFLKSPTALIGHKMNIVHPSKVKLLDYEVELAAVIGRECREASSKDALSFVVGYSVFNDVSARDYQFAEMKRGFCNIGKNFATFAPMGPFLVTADQAGNPEDLGMELRVNGRMRQLSNTKNMVFKLRELIEFFSAMTLEPGDIITSGTPSGVAIYRKPDKGPYLLKPGDIVEAKIDNLGTLQNTIVAETEAATTNLVSQIA